MTPCVVMSFMFIVVLMAMMAYNITHILNCLIYVELLVLYNFWLMMSFSMCGGMSVYLVLYYFVITVGSAASGLSVLVSVCRHHGQDFLLTYNMTF